MKVEFTEVGYLEVWRDGVKLSQHRQEREAVESVIANGAGDYEIRKPVTRVKVRRPQIGTLNIEATCS